MKNMDTNFIKPFETEICNILPSHKESIQSAIQKCIEGTNNWLNGLPAYTSSLNIRIYFIRLFSEMVQIGETLQNNKILSILLDDLKIRKIGETIEINGKKCEVIYRRISSDFGIEFGLKDCTGETINHTFYD